MHRAVRDGMRVLALLLAGGVAVGCTTTDDWGIDGSLDPVPLPGKDDGQFHAGLRADVDSSRTDVWKVVNQWDDTTTPAARAAGMAWPADSGLTWDEKFSRWVASLEWTPSLDGFSTTIKLSTPWGKTLPAPQLECAETSHFLRITFAAWYGLPLQLEAQDAHGQRVYFGHFGARTQSGRYAGTPEFAIQYRDDTATDWHAQWPHDAALRAHKLAGLEDSQPEIADGAVFGAYLDELHLNKRAGYFTLLVLDYFGSVNLADTSYTYNLQPEAVRPGDFLLERWQKVGIGHTLVIKDVTPTGNANLDVTLISGSMPRRQGVKASGDRAKEYFTGDYTGGPGTASDGTPYAKLGGGLKRWRVARVRNGYWTNTWMPGDEAHWIDSTNLAAIAARPARFKDLLGQIPLDQQKTELLAQIGDARHHLSQYPASCSAREQREQAFRQLYDVEAQLAQKSRAQVDAEQRKLEDYVFAQLDYAHSKTCCWDSSTSAMYDVVMAKAAADKAAADAMMVCTAPTVFAAQPGTDYQLWADYATSLGRRADWKPYTDDEGCAAHGITSDATAPLDVTAFCSLAH